MAKLALQNIPPKQAHFCLQVIQFLEEISFDLQDKKILIALSGGLDSTAILLFCALLQEKYRLELKVLHIDHCLRAESKYEALHVSNLCESLEIPYEIHVEDVLALSKEWKKGIEESARIVRYTHFNKAISEYKLDYIMLGHHLNDLAEDALMRQIRGTSLDKSVGMSALDTNRKLVRPFLCVSKERLKEFVEDCNIEWVEDSSNNSNDYMRNRVRNLILPQILEENPHYLKNVAQNWKQAQVDIIYWENQIKEYIPSDCNTSSFEINRQDFLSKDKALRLRIIAALIKHFESHPQADSIFKIDSLALANESNKKIIINNGLEVIIQKNKIIFQKIRV